MEILKKYQVRGAPGEVRRTNFHDRTVDFWAPPRPTPYLLVTHDGQNIFDKATSTRHRTWELAGAANKVAEEFGTTPPVIIAVFHSSGPSDPYGRGKDLAPQDVFTDGVEPVVNHPGTWPKLTTVDLPAYEMAASAINITIDELEEIPNPHKQQLWVGDLILGDSTAPHQG